MCQAKGAPDARTLPTASSLRSVSLKFWRETGRCIHGRHLTVSFPIKWAFQNERLELVCGLLGSGGRRLRQATEGGVWSFLVVGDPGSRIDMADRVMLWSAIARSVNGNRGVSQSPLTPKLPGFGRLQPH
jgi:hypothetical protein